jgi:hypothetical protein
LCLYYDRGSQEASVHLKFKLVSKIYTRNMFSDFEKKMIDCTTFDIEDDPTARENCYMLMLTNRSSKISWGSTNSKSVKTRKMTTFIASGRSGSTEV